jgi:hypothetical protein
MPRIITVIQTLSCYVKVLNLDGFSFEPTDIVCPTDFIAVV